MTEKKQTLVYLFLCILLVFSSCGNSQEEQQKSKLFFAVDGNNLQGIKEVLENTDRINLEKLSHSETTEFHKGDSANLSDRRALAIALSNTGEDPEDAIAEYLIRKGADVNDANDNWTYLDEAITNGSLELSKMLLENGADVNGGDESVLATFISFKYPNMKDGEARQKLLEEYGAKYNSEVMNACLGNPWGYLYAKDVLEAVKRDGKDSGLDKALEAAIQGDDETLQSQIKEGTVEDESETLKYAAAFCNRKTLKLMRDNGFDFAVKDDNGMTLLHIAALCNTKDVVEYLLSTGLDATSTTNEDYFQPITYAVIGAKTETLKYLLNQGYQYQRGEKYYNEDYDADFQAWSWAAACQNGSLASIQSMMDTGYECSSHDYYIGYTEGADYAVKYLLKNNIPVKPYKWGLITEGILTEYIPEVLSRGAKMSNFRFRQLCENRNLEMIKFILDNPSYSKGLDKESALEQAIGYGALDVVQYLVGQGADVNKKLDDDGEYKGCTSMHYAAQGTSADILSYLIKEGGDESIKNDAGETPLDYAKEIQKQTGINENVKILEDSINQK